MHRIYVMAEGMITGEVSREEATEQNIMRLATKTHDLEEANNGK
jgi:putative multiple sugar transport system ATP-binding protein